MELKEKLVALRKKKGLSQVELAEAINVSRQAISRWEVGSATPSADNLIWLSKFYEVSMDELVKSENLNKKAIDHILLKRQNLIAIMIAGVILIFILCYVFSAMIENKDNENLHMKEIIGEEVQTEIEGDFDVDW